MKKLPIGIQSFRKIRESDYFYVDKTEYIFNLIQSEGSIFLSRPRRFGKSLLVSTLEELFRGNRNLFEGLWIDSSGYEFPSYPLLHLDMNMFSSSGIDSLRKDLLLGLRKTAKEEGISLEDASTGAVFGNLISELYKKYNKRVVVLIDDCDKPILDNLHTVLAGAMQDELRNLFGILKSLDGYLRFVFMTGVSKFAKASVFSGANQFKDITMHHKYTNICGIERDALRGILAELSEKEPFDLEAEYIKVIKWYDGYSWDGVSFLLNPFSLLNYFSRRQFKAYWYASGTPKFLFDLIKGNTSRYTAKEAFEITEDDLDAMDIDNLSVVPLLFQTGYLTVADKLDDMGVYKLRIPNFEVNEAFHNHLLYF